MTVDRGIPFTASRGFLYTMPLGFLPAISKERGAPDRIQCDNGSEFIPRVLGMWAYDRRVMMDFSRPGKPMDNAMIESFNGSFRDECLNMNWFLPMEDAQARTLIISELFRAFQCSVSSKLTR